MKSYLVDLIGYLVSNAGSIGLGGYLGYKYGDKVEALVVKLLGYVKKI